MLHVLALGAALFGAADCVPAVTLEGQGPSLESLRTALDQRGITTGSNARDCGVRIVVATRDDALDVRILREGAPALARHVESAAEAAAVVESWARTDLIDPLLSRPRTTRRVIAPLDSAVRAAPAAPAREAPRAHTFSVGAGLALGAGDDGSTWSGADVHACAMLWRFCAGGRARYAVDLARGGITERLDGDRSTIDLIATIELPWSIGQLEIVPGIGMGQSIVVAEGNGSAGDVTEDAGGLRLRADLAVRASFAPGWAAGAELALEHAPFARAELTVPDPITREPVRLPGEPSLMVWLRVGLELEALP